jgi:2-hydroxy-3-oxopropionate reductase
MVSMTHSQETPGQTRPSKPSVGVIGTGRMGGPIARNLLGAGYTVHVYDIREEAYADLVQGGATYHDSPRAVAEASHVIILSLMTIDTVEKVLFGKDGVACAGLKGRVVIDMSTGIPSQTQRLAARVAALGGAMLDAPVTGGEGGARAGTLNIMVGGNRDAFRRCKPLLEVLGNTIVRVGPSGAGQVAKMANQVIMSAQFAAVIEAFALLEECGVDVTKALEAIETGGAQSRQLTHLGQAYRRAQASSEDEAAESDGDHYALLFSKDLHYALEEGFRHNCPLPITATVHELLKRGLAERREGSFPLRLIQLWRVNRTDQNEQE